MFFITWILSHKRWALIITLIITLIIYSVFQTWQANHLAGKLKQSTDICEKSKKQAVDNALKPYLDAAKRAQENAQKAGEDYEKTKESERVKTETITRTVQKIIERPVYINTCFDDDGVQQINSLIKADNSK